MSLERARTALASLGGSGAVRLDLSEPIAVLTLDHPQARNALSPRMMLELERAVSTLEAWPGALLLVKGAQGVFCAGSDLRMVREAVASPEGPQIAAWMQAFMADVTRRIRALPQISLAAVERAAVGGGAELMCAPDLRVIASDAKVQFVHARLGLSPGWGGAALLRGLVGRQRALQLLASAAPVDLAGTPELYTVLAGPSQAEEVGMSVLEGYSAHPPESLRGLKRALHSPADEATVFASLWGGPAQRAALARLDKGLPKGRKAD
ncbi:MAG: enoyl-CoA hydratase/isomerase family protein [Myxococcota bacterium]|nr:enoyl-CoA hydratase/isomerase family protein [Myxococcota bacterium]